MAPRQCTRPPGPLVAANRLHPAKPGATVSGRR
jgi:hypothetical protein